MKTVSIKDADILGHHTIGDPGRDPYIPDKCKHGVHIPPLDSQDYAEYCSLCNPYIIGVRDPILAAQIRKADQYA